MPIRTGQHHGFKDDDAFNEEPDSADIDALDHESALCPDCGAEIWDAAEICPKCFAYIGGNAVNRRPAPPWMRKALIILLALAMIVVTLMWFMSPAVNQGRLPTR